MTDTSAVPPADLEAARAALADNGIDGPDLPYNPRALAAMRVADQLLAEVELLRPVVEAAREFGTLVLRGSWSEEQAAEFIAATQARGEVR